MTRLLFSRHARNRMLDWRVDVRDVRTALEDGDTIEEYEDGARLVLGRAGIRPLHVVVAEAEAGTMIVITVYEPSAARWDPSFRRRIGS